MRNFSAELHLVTQTLTQAWKATAGLDGQIPMQAERLPPGHDGVGGVGPGGVGPGVFPL